MKLDATRFTEDFTTLSFEAENQAERYQLAALKKSLMGGKVHVHDWDNMEGNSGIAVRLLNEETKEKLS